MKRRRLGVPRWAEVGRTYRCNDKCGFRFLLQPDGRWQKGGDGYNCIVESWADLEDRFGDCSARLERVYGGQFEADQGRARRFPRWTVTCNCRGLSPHLHYRGRRWFG